MPLKPSSAKAKGRIFQQWVVNELIRFAPGLQPDDIRSTAMGQNGVDVLLSPLARKYYNYDIECKNVEKLNIWEAIRQAASNSVKSVPAVFFKRNNHKPWVAIPAEEFFRLKELEFGRLYENKNNSNSGDLSTFDQLLRGLQVWRESVGETRD